MKREDVKKYFPEATDEQITQILNQHNAEVQNEKKKSEGLKEQGKEDKEKAEALEQEKAELEKKLAEIEDGKLSEIEKANKALESAQAEIAELKKAQFISSQRADAVTQFNITSEQAREVVRDDGSFDMAKLGAIISEKENAAALAKEQEIAAISGNPNGLNGNPNSDVSFAANLAVESAKTSNKANQSIIDMYKR